ncbi:MAG: polysaccharide deacetylase family protein, partial [Lachnospiraceae bacterium]|nr:polysaccharide deacetylase family protein [Lachnospiraceae bacterium]
HDADHMIGQKHGADHIECRSVSTNLLGQNHAADANQQNSKTNVNPALSSDLPVWPDNKRIAVMLAFDLDAETMWTTRGDGNADHITNLSRGAYGPKQGVPRILDMLDTWKIRATFFIPGIIAEKYPDVVREISRRGHEIGFHGYKHEEFTTTTYEEEDATMHRAESIIRDICGQQLSGHRAPGGVIHNYSLRLFLEHGYIYSSNWRDSDGPFIHKIDGKEVPLVELPKDSIFDDTAYDFYTDSPPERYELKSPREMYEIWKEEFDSLAAEGRMINFVLHPQFIGRASRVNMLSDLIGYMLAHGAWVDTNYNVASYILKLKGLKP